MKLSLLIYKYYGKLKLILTFEQEGRNGGYKDHNF